jgi:hypothetical protein
MDGETGKIKWLGAKKGLSSDFDGEPTTKRHNLKDAKPTHQHRVHMGGKKSTHKVHMGGESCNE